ncbi:hypothetical protein ACIP4U_04340 [Streptomyces caelestis]|uniref:hypothetical protein n=1 Tax=Streptomyces caelestis TaxID=36816 RepID=UPI003810C403
MADPQSNAAVPAHPPLPPGAPRSGVIHIRHRHTDRFTVVGNHLAQHPALSAVAIGLGVYIQSLPDGVSVTVKALALRFREGETTIARALNELEAAGYLERRRVSLGGGRVATRTVFYDRPGCDARETQSTVPAAVPPADDAGAAEPPKAQPQDKPSPPPPTQGPAADLLARLRLADPRLLLSAHDVRRLAPAVDTWLARSATPAQITRTLTASLPPASEPIHHPARFLEHRLTVLLPPPLPPDRPTAVPAATAVVPLQTCDGCERAFRSHDPTARCRDCRPAVGAAA